jgi:GTP-binding protein
VAVKTEWNDFTKDYFKKRKTLVSVLLLVDASIPPLQIDLDCAAWLGKNKVETIVILYLE